MLRALCIWLAVASLLGFTPKHLRFVAGAPCCPEDCCSMGRGAPVAEPGCSKCVSEGGEEGGPSVGRGCDCDHDDPLKTSRIPPLWLVRTSASAPWRAAEREEPRAFLRPASRVPSPRPPPPRG